MSNYSLPDLEKFADFCYLSDALVETWDMTTDKQKGKVIKELIKKYLNIESANLAKIAKMKVSVKPEIYKLFISQYKGDQ